ncbi:MAG: hypothetical protein ACO3QT_08405, partial [Burkholderiaceae bacterium]
MSYRIYPPEVDPTVLETSKLSDKAAERTVIREFESGVTAGLVPLDNFSKRLALRCVEAAPVTGVVFALPAGPEGPSEIRNAKSLWVVITGDQHKLQFLAHNVNIGSYDLITADFPQEVLAIQRRESFRVMVPMDNVMPLQILISGSYSTPVTPKVIDIGFQGVAVEFISSQPLQVGTIWSKASFQRGKRKSEKFMLQVINVSDPFNLDHYR